MIRFGRVWLLSAIVVPLAMTACGIDMNKVASVPVHQATRVTPTSSVGAIFCKDAATYQQIFELYLRTPAPQRIQILTPYFNAQTCTLLTNANMVEVTSASTERIEIPIPGKEQGFVFRPLKVKLLNGSLVGLNGVMAEVDLMDLNKNRDLY